MDDSTDTATPKRTFHRLHKERCGFSRQEYDSYADVREACERKLAQWEREGTLCASWRGSQHDWLFGAS